MIFRGLLIGLIAQFIAPPLLAAQEATLFVTGVVPTICEVAFGENANPTLSDFDPRATSTLRAMVTVDCNVPMLGEVSSANGGLINQVAVAGAYTGGINEVEYTIEIDFPSLPLVGPFESDSLVNGITFDSGQTVLFEETATVRINLKTADRLYAGDYSDTLTFRVEPLE